MTIDDYLEVILKGYVDNADNLDKHFYRECKEAEAKHIDYLEFFTRLMKAYDVCVQYRDNQYHHNLKRLYYQPIQIYHEYKAAGKELNFTLEDIEKQKPNKEDIWINPYNFTHKIEYACTLSSPSLDYIGNSISKAFFKTKADKQPAKDQSKQAEITIDSESFIKIELQQTLKDIEAKIKPHIEFWNKGKDKIKCAAFVELLMDRNYFNAVFKTENIKNCTTFAASRYNCKIENQMLSKEKQNRNTHKKLLEKYFK